MGRVVLGLGLDLGLGMPGKARGAERTVWSGVEWSRVGRDKFEVVPSFF